MGEWPTIHLLVTRSALVRELELDKQKERTFRGWMTTSRSRRTEERGLGVNTLPARSCSIETSIQLSFLSQYSRSGRDAARPESLFVPRSHLQYLAKGQLSISSTQGDQWQGDIKLVPVVAAVVQYNHGIMSRCCYQPPVRCCSRDLVLTEQGNIFRQGVRRLKEQVLAYAGPSAPVVSPSQCGQ